MKIDIKGHSGCKIDIIRENGDLLIEKSTSNPKYFERLIKQAKKQESAICVDSKMFAVPKIFNILESTDMCSIKMEYIYSRNYIEYFEKSGLEEITHFTDSIINYIESEIKQSSPQLINSSIIELKINDILLASKQNSCLKTNFDVLENIENACAIIKQNCCNIIIPVGICHGDLTFSNILFSGTKYYLIDFLDSFIESPIIDIVKVRQDTEFGWSKLMYMKSFDKIRLNIISNKIDQAINSHFSKYEWYNKYYKLFQLINFLRIIQYASDSIVIKYLNDIIKKMIYEFNINCANSSR